MFEKDLIRRLEIIFGFKKTTLSAASESYEQNTLFVDILTARCHQTGVEGGKEIAKVTGSLTVYSQGDRFPYGYMAKRIAKAPYELTKDFFFFDFDTNIPDSPANFQNIYERRTGFIFFYDSQYDPERGELTELSLQA